MWYSVKNLPEVVQMNLGIFVFMLMGNLLFLASGEGEVVMDKLMEMPAGYALQYYDECGVAGREEHIPGAQDYFVWPTGIVIFELVWIE
jgi:hypothetical protein